MGAGIGPLMPSLEEQPLVGPERRLCTHGRNQQGVKPVQAV
jgi:hypothetical protein